MEEVESRFVHLLQPIRDLTKNWEVDVAAQLGEYLEELDQICISFDNGKTTMNFIEAALVIQGSACVYSRKVEYLYSLVYQTLDFISNKKREKLPSSVGQDDRDADATFGAEEKEEFLSLDDIRDSSQANVDMRKDHQPNLTDIVPLTPMSLVLPEEAEKRDNPLFSRKGEVLASRRDFRMNTCTPHATGAFLLELAGFSPTSLQEQQRVGSPGRAAGALSGVLGSSGDPVQVLSFSEDRGAAGPDDDDVPGAPEDDVEMIPAAHEHVKAQRSAPRPRGYVLRERAPAEDPPAHIKEMLDPWQSLDPFADSEDKPFKKGRPFLVPHGLDDVVGGKRKRKGSRKLQDFMIWFSAASIGAGPVAAGVSDLVLALLELPRQLHPVHIPWDANHLPWCRISSPGLVPSPKLRGEGGELSKPEAAGRAPHPSRALNWTRSQQTQYDNVADSRKTRRKGPTFADLELLYWKQLKERMAAQRKLQSRAGLPPCEEEPDLLEDEREADSDEAADDFAEHDDMQPEAPEELGEGDLGLPDPGSLGYEELVRRNVELFMANSQKYAQETELSQHIRRWEDRMGPLLQEQEDRATFDIHSYGDALADRCGDLGQWQTFASLVAGQPPFEVCRYMLASLQLANDYVVELAQEPGLEQALDTMRLRLLTHRRAHERFHTFQPPSACP
ncbi:condensin-2 complex subunit H2 isoform X1 [Chroicocephalus ridibundus]|uniref:condensin-2 complex subunit H2 isoform X1 n=1 Tax=Chroicocephalus ridibundus TaxID=1192867 RepID=UPI002FDEF2DA